ncbi:diacylglycerol kinase family enzyme [Sphingomonas sp. UYAg733]
MTDAIPVLINSRGGTAASKGDTLADEVRTAFADAGLQIDLRLLDADGLRDAIKELKGERLIVVGGGDGTLGCAARILVERGDGSALGILPLGTRNHLARELGIPLDLAGAAKVIAARDTRKIDVAWAADRMFLNNASIGLYPQMVELREDTQRRHKMAKWLAAIPASIATLRRIRHHRLRLRSAEGERQIVTPMLFVGNNHYEIEQGHPGKRNALDDGLLSVFAIGPSHRFQLVDFAIRSLLGRTRRDRDFAAIGDVAELEVSGPSSAVDIALDGEVTELKLPFTFRIDPLALTVVAPPPPVA